MFKSLKELELQEKMVGIRFHDPRITITDGEHMYLNWKASKVMNAIPVNGNGRNYKYTQIYWDKEDKIIMFRLWKNRVRNAYSLSGSKTGNGKHGVGISARKFVGENNLRDECKKIGKAHFPIVKHPDYDDVWVCQVA